MLSRISRALPPVSDTSSAAFESANLPWAAADIFSALSGWAATVALARNMMGLFGSLCSQAGSEFWKVICQLRMPSLAERLLQTMWVSAQAQLVMSFMLLCAAIAVCACCL